MPATGKQEQGEMKLLPCPWCKAMPTPFDSDPDEWIIVRHRPACFYTHTHNGHPRQKIHRSAYVAWNTRTVPASSCEAMRAAAKDVLDSGVEFDDPRLHYVTMQIDRQTLAALRATLGEKGE